MGIGVFKLLSWLVLSLSTPHVCSATKVHLRRDVYDFFKQENGPQRDLFLQAFAFIQNLPAEDYRSYYQIAGIHGLPYEPYRGSTNTKWPWTTANLSWGGYCHHGSVLFPPWHRAHMLLIESVLQKVAISIAKDFKPSLQKTYLAAAQSMRFPYWDWSHRSVPMKGMPTIFTLKTVVVATAPNGSKKSIPNPLRSFAVPKAVGRTQPCSNCNPWNRPYKVTNLNPGLFFYPYTPKGYMTTRQPDANNRTNDMNFQKSVRLYAKSDWLTGVFAMLHQTSWLRFASHSSTPYGTNDNKWLEYYASLEAVHDAVHYGMGGWGAHISYPQVAGFDPIFFFHHSNVDRLFALWQAANPNTYVTPATLPDGTYTIPPGTLVDQDTPLTPFRSGDGSAENKYYTARMLRDVKRLGYSYPELQNKRVNDPKKFKKWILDMFRPMRNYYSTRWYVDLPRAKINNAPGPFAVRVFVGFLGAPNAGTSLSTRHYAGSLFVWKAGLIRGTIKDVVELTETMRNLGLSVNPVPNLTIGNDLTNISATIGSITGYPITKKVLKFVPVGLDGKDYSKYVTIGEPRIYFVREDANTGDFVTRVVLPVNATYPIDAVVAIP